MAFRPNRTPERVVQQIEHLFTTTGMNKGQIAAAIGCSGTTVCIYTKELQKGKLAPSRITALMSAWGVTE